LCPRDLLANHFFVFDTFPWSKAAGVELVILITYVASGWQNFFLFSSHPDVQTSQASSENSFVDYNVITVGATANHSMGFKHGGLLEFITGTDDYAKRYETNIR